MSSTVYNDHYNEEDTGITKKGFKGFMKKKKWNEKINVQLYNIFYNLLKLPI